MSDITIALHPDGWHFLLTIPGKHGYEVKAPIDERGMFIMRRVLQERAANPEAKIGESGAPTQHIINEWLKANEPKKLSANKREAELDQKYLELFGDEELELEIKL